MTTTPTTTADATKRSPITWVPSLYFVQGLQFFVVMLIANLMFKNMGVPNDVNTRWTGILGLAWALKPLWSPFLEVLHSKKFIVVTMQYTGALGLGLLTIAMQQQEYFVPCVAVLFFIAYAAATHDIACDGLYMASLSKLQQAAYVGWQGAFFNASKFLANGGLLILVGILADRYGMRSAWTAVFAGLAVLVAVLATYNMWALPGVMSTAHRDFAPAAIWATTVEIVGDFFSKKGIWLAVLFIVLFRISEGQVQTIGPLFMLEARDKGGLGLTNVEMGAVYGTAGTIAFLAGSILGGYFTAWLGLKRAMPLLIVAMTVPAMTFYCLAATGTTDLSLISILVCLESFFYGFGFVGMILYIMQAVAPGKYQTAHYALGTGVMQLGFILAKTISGDIQVAMGYEKFFLWTIVCGAPALLMLFFVKVPGREEQLGGSNATAEAAA